MRRLIRHAIIYDAAVIYCHFRYATPLRHGCRHYFRDDIAAIAAIYAIILLRCAYCLLPLAFAVLRH